MVINIQSIILNAHELFQTEYMDKNIKASRYGRLQEPDLTIRSIDSAYATGNGRPDNPKKPHEGKIKAYVDFTEFNKNYAEYLEKKGISKLKDKYASRPESDKDNANGDKKNLERQNSSSSNQSEESWEVLS